LVGNLPFNISTALLLKWLKQSEEKTGPFTRDSGKVKMLLTFQYEVGQRIVAAGGTSAYNRLSIMSQRLCETRQVMTIKGNSFVPPPKVDSSVVLLIPRDKPIQPQVSFESIEALLRHTFTQRRKKLSNALSVALPGLSFPALSPPYHLTGDERAQDIPIQTWCVLAQIYEKQQQSIKNAIT